MFAYVKIVDFGNKIEKPQWKRHDTVFEKLP